MKSNNANCNEVLCFPKSKTDVKLTESVLRSSIDCPCDRCTHTLISPRLLEQLQALEWEGIKFQVVRGFICQMYWVSKYGCTSGNKCLQGLALHVRVFSKEGIVGELLPGIKASDIGNGCLELTVTAGDTYYVSGLGKTGES